MSLTKKILLGVLAVILVLAGFAAYTLATTKNHSPVTTANHETESLKMSVTYCQPYKKGRMIFGPKKDGALQPWGVYWRAGANEATEITFSKDVNFGGKDVKAGTYVVYAIPNQANWIIGLNSELGRWGYGEVDHDLDVVQVNAAVQAQSPALEQFTIDFTNGPQGTNFNLRWDETMVSVPVQAL